MATKKKPVDIDALIAEDVEAAEEARTYKAMTIFGRDWRVSTSPNIYASLGAELGEPEAIAHLIIDLIHEDEQAEFRRVLLSRPTLDAKVFMKLLNSMIEAIAEHPTTSPSGSSRSPSGTQAGRQKSAAT